MNLTQTLNSSLPSWYGTSNNNNLSDILGVIAVAIGVIAIGIAIFAYKMQGKWNTKIERVLTVMEKYIEHQKMIEDSVRSNSLVAIKGNAETSNWQLGNVLIQLRQKPGLEYLNELLFKVGFGNVLKATSENILRYNENLKFLIMPSLHQEIESVGQKVRIASDLDQLGIRNIPNGHESWIAFAEDTIRITYDMLSKIEKELGTKDSSMIS